MKFHKRFVRLKDGGIQRLKYLNGNKYINESDETIKEHEIERMATSDEKRLWRNTKKFVKRL